ncbi:hypothetical protein HY491_04405, partial [Candidatus Woesearchaeota archaeon]|nr:hypothetical protein [Candidatus Woesearchaeota archaeon]
IRQFAAYLQSGGKTIPGASLQDLVPDGRKLKDILSYKILKQDDAEKYHDAEKN